MIPPAGYSLKGAAFAIGKGCVETGLAFVAAAGLAAPFTGGASAVGAPAAAYAGCVQGAQGGAFVYMLIGDSGWSDTSIIEDVRSFIYY